MARNKIGQSTRDYDKYRVDGVPANEDGDESITVAVQPELDGEVVSDTNPMPVQGIPLELTELANTQQERILEAVENVEAQLKIMNLHLQNMTGEKITKGDINV